MNVLISGGTSSGKITIARALLAMSHDDERLVTIEDAVELRPEHKTLCRSLLIDKKDLIDLLQSY